MAPPSPAKGILGDRVEKNSLLGFSYSMNLSYGDSYSPKEITSAVTGDLASDFGVHSMKETLRSWDLNQEPLGCDPREPAQQEEEWVLSARPSTSPLNKFSSSSCSKQPYRKKDFFTLLYDIK